MSVRPATSTLEAFRADLRVTSGLERATVAVLLGGRSNEREVSISSGVMVLRALSTPDSRGDRRGPASVIGVEVLTDGRWRVGGRSLSPGEALSALENVDLFFLALHGGEGENGTLQGFLTCSDRAFTGSGVIASGLCMDKGFARTLMSARGARVAPGVELERGQWQRPTRGLRERLEELASAGCVVKPRRGGSSVGCSIVRGSGELPAALERAFAWGGEVLVEGYVRGVEVTGGVLEEPGGVLHALPPVEIRPRGLFFDYSEKYSDDGATELCPPEGLSEEVCERVRILSLAAHRTLGCAGYSRTDFVVPHDDPEPVFLETNTLPGLTPRSLLPKAAAAIGIDYRSLCLWISAHGLGRERRAG